MDEPVLVSKNAMASISRLTRSRKQSFASFPRSSGTDSGRPNAHGMYTEHAGFGWVEIASPRSDRRVTQRFTLPGAVSMQLLLLFSGLPVQALLIYSHAKSRSYCLPEASECASAHLSAACLSTIARTSGVRCPLPSARHATDKSNFAPMLFNLLC